MGCDRGCALSRNSLLVAFLPAVSCKSTVPTEPYCACITTGEEDGAKDLLRDSHYLDMLHDLARSQRYQQALAHVIRPGERITAKSAQGELP